MERRKPLQKAGARRAKVICERRYEMELLIAVGAVFALDLLAQFFGFDSRDNHDRAIDAAHRGDFKAFRHT